MPWSDRADLRTPRKAAPGIENATWPGNEPNAVNKGDLNDTCSLERLALRLGRVPLVRRDFSGVLELRQLGYTYRAHGRFGQQPMQGALEILNQRYARGEIKPEEYRQMKIKIAKA
jgi:hypothetical protein